MTSRKHIGTKNIWVPHEINIKVIESPRMNAWIWELYDRKYPMNEYENE